MQRLSANNDTDMLQRKKTAFLDFKKNQTRHNKPIIGYTSNTQLSTTHPQPFILNHN